MSEVRQRGNPLHRQEVGDYYSNKAIQPVEFAMANGLDPCAFSIVKYASRHREKNGREDVAKAMHFLDLRQHTYGSWVKVLHIRMVAKVKVLLRAVCPGDIRQETLDSVSGTAPHFWGRTTHWEITPNEYCQANRMHPDDAEVIIALGDFLDCAFNETPLRAALQTLLDHYDKEITDV